MVRFAAFFVMLALGCVYSTSSTPIVTSDHLFVTSIRAEWILPDGTCECAPGRAELAAYLGAAQVTVGVGFTSRVGGSASTAEGQFLVLPTFFRANGAEGVSVRISDGMLSAAHFARPPATHRIHALTPTGRVVDLGAATATRGMMRNESDGTHSFDSEWLVALRFLDPSGSADGLVAAGGNAFPQYVRLVIRATYSHIEQ